MIASAPSADKLPAGTRLTLDQDLRVLGRGRLLVGGVPLRVVRLTSAGALAVARWSAGEPVEANASHRALARRLVGAGLAHPQPCVVEPLPAAIVVITRDRLSDLRACLASLAAAERVVVIDDGSDDAEGVRLACADHGASVLRHPSSLGPAAARNTGLRATRDRLVCFVDSDCRVRPGSLDLCLAHFADPAVGAVGPRVSGPADQSLLGRFETVRSPLDLGSRACSVTAEGRVRYLPATALCVRRAAAGDGFCEALRLGEDVDFIWRIQRAGWTVRYEPRARVDHPHRRALARWVGQRAGYGSSAAVLARRHPDCVSHLSLAPSLAAPWMLALAGARRGAAMAFAATLAAACTRTSGSARLRFEVAAFFLRAQLQAADHVAKALRRAYLPPVFVLCARSRRARLAIAVATFVPPLAEWTKRRPRLDPFRYLALCLLDDASYATGLWYGCLRRRTIRPLLPRIRSRR